MTENHRGPICKLKDGNLTQMDYLSQSPVDSGRASRRKGRRSLRWRPVEDRSGMADGLSDLIARIYDAALDQGCGILFSTISPGISPTATPASTCCMNPTMSTRRPSRRWRRPAVGIRASSTATPSISGAPTLERPGPAARRGRGHGQRHAGSPQFAGADEFYSDWLRPQQLLSGIGGTFLRRGGVSAHISVLHASPMAEQDTERLTALMRSLLPHFARRPGPPAARRRDHQRDALETGLDRCRMG